MKRTLDDEELALSLHKQHGTDLDRARELVAKRRTVATAIGPIEVGANSPLLQKAGARAGTRPEKRTLPPDAIDPAGRMNGIERRRALELEALKRSGEIDDWRFEAIKLTLADNTTYRPDFLIVNLETRSFRIEEVKGHWEDDARVKIKVAARLFPFFQFRALRPRPKAQGGGWHIEEIRP